MKYQVAASLLTFMLGIAISVIVPWLRIAPVQNIETPPCRACERLYAASEIPSVSICELTDNLDHYRGKVVRVSAFFQHDAGQVILIDSSCGSGGVLHAGLSVSCQSCAGARKVLSIYTGFETWYDGSARVVVVGWVGTLENPTLFSDDNGFNIDCIERVEPAGPDTERRLSSWLPTVSKRGYRSGRPPCEQ